MDTVAASRAERPDRRVPSSDRQRVFSHAERRFRYGLICESRDCRCLAAMRACRLLI
jgi:hypothetical protein